MEWQSNRKLGSGGTFKPVTLASEPSQVWTLWGMTEHTHKPELPFTPVFRTNAFPEDAIHDWNFRGGMFRYYTRVMNHSVWVLVEYKEFT
jgi:hypothetical protein